MNETIDNQQGNNNIKIGYIIGMIDGEGTITFTRSGKTNVSPLYCKISPQITITNTDEKIIKLLSEYCKQLQLPHYVYISKKSIRNRFVMRIVITGHNRLKKWIELLDKYDFSKKDRLKLIKKYISLREEKISIHPFKKPYSEDEITIYNTVRFLNEKGGKSRHMFVGLDVKRSELKNRQWKYDKMIELINKNWSQKKIANFFNIDQSSVSKWIKRNIVRPSTTTIGNTLNKV